jgi:hypothetical protein
MRNPVGLVSTPAIIKVEPFNPVDAILDVDTALAFHFIAYSLRIGFRSHLG